MYLCHPIRELLDLIDQSSYLIYSMFLADLNSKETSLYEITYRGDYVCRYIFFLFFSYYFQRQSRFSWIAQPFRKKMEELDGIDIDDIRNLEDLLRIVFINEEWGNLKVFVDGREFNWNINK